jgi:type IV pilus assembly protein PilE
MLHKSTGFTLIELLIAVAVIVILAAIAIPIYNTFTQKSARSDAMAVLMDLRLEQEKYRLKNPNYAVTLGSVNIDSTSPNNKYDIDITAAGVASFTATATPTGSQVSDSCGTFAINQSGPDTTGSYANDSCWRR